jgi:predicted transcriptional regulator
MITKPIAEDEAVDEKTTAAIEEGLADLKAGRSVPYEKVRRWLLSWGSDRALPPPKCQ